MFGNNDKVIQKKVDVTGGGFFSKKIFQNNYDKGVQNPYSPAPGRHPDLRVNTNRRQTSPGRRGITAVNTYEYQNNTGKKMQMGVDQRQSQSMDFKPTVPKQFKTFKPSPESTQKDTKDESGIKRDSQGSSSSNKMQKIQLSMNKNDEMGSNSHKSNNSFRIADNLFEINGGQNQFQNSFTDGQFKYQAKPPSPTKKGKF